MSGASFPSELFSSNSNIAADHVSVFSSFVSTTINWVPETTANMYVIIEDNDTVTINLEDSVSVTITQYSDTRITVTINDGSVLEYTSGDTFSIGTSTFTIGSIAVYTDKPIPVDLSKICILGSELICTDNMSYKPIAALSVKDTIHGYKISRIIRTKIREKKLVLIKKNAIGNGVPFKDTKITHDHKIHINGRLIPCRQLLTNIKFPDVVECNYNDEILYNVLLEIPNKTMNINGIKCETLTHKYTTGSNQLNLKLI